MALAPIYLQLTSHREILDSYGHKFNFLTCRVKYLEKRLAPTSFEDVTGISSRYSETLS